MTPVQIVRALAAADPETDDQGCQFCGARGPSMFSSREQEPHDPTCPWRLAVEWVAAEDAASSCRDCGARYDDEGGCGACMGLLPKRPVIRSTGGQ